jgi:hypothetical protein
MKKISSLSVLTGSLVSLSLIAACAAPTTTATRAPASRQVAMSKKRSPADDGGNGSGKIPTSNLKYIELKVDPAVHLTNIPIDTSDPLESPVVSPDGDKILVTQDTSKKFGKAPTNLFIKKLSDPSDLGTKLTKEPGDKATSLVADLEGPGNLFIKGAFSHSGEIAACELLFHPKAIIDTFENHQKTGEWDPVGYDSVLSFFKPTGNGYSREDDKMLHPTDVGLDKTVFLEHPRFSPDQKWLVFYVQKGAAHPTDADEGVYIYNFASQKSTWLGHYPDKHPTFDATGNRIFFHEQGKLASDGKTEVARVGYYDLNFSGNTVSVKQRVIFSEGDQALGSDFVYQKHPAPHAGLNLVFFHVQTPNSDGTKLTKSLAAISLEHPDHAPILIKMKSGDHEIKHAEHADVSEALDSPVYFVGREDDDAEAKLYMLDLASLKQVQAEFNK